MAEHYGPTIGGLFGAAWRAPLRHPGALLRLGFLPLLISMIAWPPSYSLSANGTTMSLGDDTLTGWDFVRFLIWLPCTAAFAAAWVRLIAYDAETDMGRPPIALDFRTWQVTWALLRLVFAMIGLLLALFILSLAFFGHYQDGNRSFNFNFNYDGLAAIPLILGLLVGLLLFVWFILRLSLVIPAAAVGEQGFSLRASWRLTGPLHGRLLAAATLLALAYGALTVAFVFLQVVLAAVLPFKAVFYGGLVPFYLLYVYGNALWAGLLGAAYGAVAATPADADVAKVFS